MIVGDGTRRGWLEEQLKLHALHNVVLLPYQPRSVVPHLWCDTPLLKYTVYTRYPVEHD